MKGVHGVPLTGNVRLTFRRRKRIFRSLRRSTSDLADELRQDADNQLESAITDSRRSYEKGIADDCRVNPKRFWSHVRSSFGNKPTVTSVRDSHGVLTESIPAAANYLNEFFWFCVF